MSGTVPLMDSNGSALVVVDVQDRLANAMADRAETVRRVSTLLRSAERLDVPVLASEQYAKGIGHLVTELAGLVPPSAVVEKMHFSCLSEPGFADRFRALDRRQAVVCGMEAHVCVLQTAIALQHAGYETFVAADACSSRAASDKAAGLARMARAGVTVVTTEMVVFEWLHRAGTEAFRDLLGLIK
jgi:nicotinamidase-related amidase